MRIMVVLSGRLVQRAVLHDHAQRVAML